jgi:pyruvate-formate lyase-activating enzyme
MSQAVMDDAEIARLRVCANTCGFMSWEATALLDALEQARKDVKRITGERDWRYEQLANTTRELNETRDQRDQAQKDAKDARALLRDAWPFVPENRPDDLHARIEALLEQKP